MSEVNTGIDVEVEECLARAPVGHLRSSSLPLMIFDRSSSINNRLFDYTRIPDELLKLTVVKLDGSSFDIEVGKSATVAELRDAVEDVFTHTNISWLHVWENFCLCYDGQKLVEATDHITDYGIRDGNELEFTRYNSTEYYSPSKKRLLKRVTSLGNQWKHDEKEQCDEEAGRYDDMETGRHWHLDDLGCSIAEDDKAAVVPLFQRHSCPRLPVTERTRSFKDSPPPSSSGSTSGFIDNCKKILFLQ